VSQKILEQTCICMGRVQTMLGQMEQNNHLANMLTLIKNMKCHVFDFHVFDQS
jgi:hypothetical protein